MQFRHPLTFRPIFMQRVWGGRRLADKLGKPLPPDVPIGESWELVDRHDAQSVVEHGEHAGLTLHELWSVHREAVFGEVPDAPRFPLLAKILDARETLSVQVHPPASIARKLGGEPKTEVWYLLEADPGAELFAGFRAGVDRDAFNAAIERGEVPGLLHRIPVQAGDTLFIPSGRCHAIGGGCLIVELQQNSDTTYRVFDWDRMGLDGKPRALHLEESRLSINFADHEPALAPPDTPVACDFFQVERLDLSEPYHDPNPSCSIYTVVGGRLQAGAREFRLGDFFLLTATATDKTLHPLTPGTQVLKTTMPR